MNFYSYVPREGHGLQHNPLPEIIGPRPIAWVSTKSSEGAVNLAPYSFFNLFNYDPPIIAFASVGWKDSIKNIEASREFVCNIATRELAESLNRSSASLPYGSSEFEFAGLKAVDGTSVNAPRVAEAAFSLECEVLNIVQLKSLQGEMLQTWLVTAEVVYVHIRKDMIDQNCLSFKEFGQILRAGGTSDYLEVKKNNFFYMKRPKL